MDAVWLKYLPGVLRTKISGRAEAQAIIGNSGWLLADKAVRLFIGLPIGIWLARALGPDSYGQLNYAIAFVAIFGAIAAAGLDGIVVRELIRQPANGRGILATAFLLKLISGTLAFVVTLSIALVIDSPDPRTFGLVAVIAAGMVFESFNVIDFWYQSRVLSRYVVAARMIAFLLGSVATVVLILIRASLIAFAWVGLFQTIIGALCLFAIYTAQQTSKSGYRPQMKMARNLLSESWPLLLAGLAIMLYMRVDMVMLQQMTTAHEVGIYAAATRLSEVWYVLPMVICTSAFPAILRQLERGTDEYLIGIRNLYFHLVWLAIAISLPMSLGAHWIVTTLYGATYTSAGTVLAVQLWASIAVFLGVGSSQHLLAANLQTISFYRTAIGLVCNIALNLVLIPRYQALGAAIATVISYSVATFSLVIFPQTRSHAGYMILALFTRPSQHSAPQTNAAKD